MPRVKIRRSDILRPKEIQEVAEKALKDVGLWLACVISLCVIFGKRITEVMSLRREQIFVDKKFLTIKFRVGKKRVKDSPIPIYYAKRKTLKNPLISKYILPYIARVNEGYIFPSSRKARTITQKQTVKLKDGTIKKLTYTYEKEGGYICRDLARYYLKKVTSTWWWHLCRESLATRMAEEGATEEELMHWFDWDTPASAHKYVKRGTKLTEKWSERTW